VNLSLLYEEKTFVNHQFPMVTSLADPPNVYEGLIRCEKGEVMDLAEKKIWPFTEYINWHRFRLELLNEYPVKPPVVTWLTDISHPNIVPNISGAVCVSVLGEAWRPDLKIVSVINSLYYLLSAPNPDNVFDHPKCIEAAKVCRDYGFPNRGTQKKPREEEDIMRFNIIPVPGVTQPDTILTFGIPGRTRQEATR
jgi:ubiquitin-protein ligase